MKTELIKKAVSLYKKTLKSSSKWFEKDVADFKCNISKKSLKDIERIVNNFTVMNDEKSTFNKEVRREERLMLKAGLYDVGNMKHANALD